MHAEARGDESRLGLIIFETTNIGMKVDRILKGAEIPCRVIPTPVEITSDCGISILIEEKWVEKARRAIRDSHTEDWQVIFPFVRGKRVREGKDE